MTGTIRRLSGYFIVALCLVWCQAAEAAVTTVRGRIVITQGHIVPGCRTVTLKRNDNGSLMSFRIANTGIEDGVMAVTLTALTTRLDTEITYDPTAVGICGTEPVIIYISLIAPS